jgi:hypothetical protein
LQILSFSKINKKIWFLGDNLKEYDALQRAIPLMKITGLLTFAQKDCKIGIAYIAYYHNRFLEG